MVDLIDTIVYAGRLKDKSALSLLLFHAASHPESSGIPQYDSHNYRLQPPQHLRFSEKHPKVQ